MKKTFLNPATNKQWRIEIDGHTIRTCLNGGKAKEGEIVNILEITERSCLVENSIEEILNQSWSRVPSEIFIRLHWERPL